MHIPEPHRHPPQVLLQHYGLHKLMPHKNMGERICSSREYNSDSQRCKRQRECNFQRCSLVHYCMGNTIFHDVHKAKNGRSHGASRQFVEAEKIFYSEHITCIHPRCIKWSTPQRIVAAIGCGAQQKHFGRLPAGNQGLLLRLPEEAPRSEEPDEPLNPAPLE